MWAAPLALYLLSRLVLYLATIYAGRATLIGGAGSMLSGWDAGHYLDIVENGYPAHVNPTLYSPVAFFPGFPVVVRTLRAIFSITPLESGVVVALVAGALFIFVATRLVAATFGDVAARRAGMLLAVFPGSYVLFVPYAESMACLFVALALLAVRREQPYRAGVWGALATFTSPVTIPLVVALLVAAWRRRDRQLAVGAVISAAGFVAYMVYLGQRTGDLFIWFRAEAVGFGAHFHLTASIDHLRIWPGVGTLFVLSFGVAVVGIYALWRVKAPIEWITYSALIVLSTLFDAALWVNPRVLFNAFPLLIALGVWLRRDAYRVVLGLSAALLPVVFLMYFTIGSVTGPP